VSTNVVARRLANQRLVGPPYASLAEAVSRMGAVQAQDYAGAKWALGQRVHDVTDAGVERALAHGTILRTHVLRPTWHLVAAVDIRWMLALTAPRIRALMGHYDRRLGLDAAVYKKSHATIAKALRDGDRTRTELADALTRARVDLTGSQRLGHLLMRAELDALICSGARRGKQATYALLDDRSPAGGALPRDEALAELATRYFSTRGPASIRDFSWWAGLTMADATRGAELAVGVLKREIIDGLPYWSAAGEPAVKGTSSSAHLLPNFDEYYIAYKDRSAMLSAPTKRGDSPWLPGLTDNLLLFGGRLAGSWRRGIGTKGVTIVTSTTRSLTKSEHSRLAAQVKRYATFLAAPVAAHTHQNKNT
jgi:hypothetical protein